jgi:flagellar motor switch protein FliN/FliY
VSDPRADISPILKLEVPVIVVLASRRMPLREVVALTAGAILELPTKAEEELEILVNNKVIGTGKAVKVGENFGIRLSFVGDLRDRVSAMGPDGAGDGAGDGTGDAGTAGEPGADGNAPADAAGDAPPDADALAEAMLAGQS